MSELNRSSSNITAILTDFAAYIDSPEAAHVIHQTLHAIEHILTITITVLRLLK